MKTTIKESQLKAVIKNVVREALSEREYQRILSEVSPPGRKAERMIKHVKTSLRKSHPEWDDDKITSVAIATGWKSHNKQRLDEAGLTSETGEESRISPLDDIVTLVLKKTQDPEKVKFLVSQLYLHQMGSPADMDAVNIAIDKQIGGMNEDSYKQVSPNETDISDEDKAREIQTDPKVTESSYKQVSPNETDTAEEDKARKIQTEPKVTENQKVQARSAKTIEDLDNDPQNVRDPEVPQA